jgi:hypothetical protein
MSDNPGMIIFVTFAFLVWNFNFSLTLPTNQELILKYVEVFLMEYEGLTTVEGSL